MNTGSTSSLERAGRRDSSGLVVTGGGTTIRGLAIGGWAFYGVDLQSGGNFLGTNIIGLTPAGTALGNGRRTTSGGAPEG